MPRKDDEFNKIAALAYLETNMHTTQQLANDVSAIMAFVKQLHEIDTTSIAPLLHPLDLHQRLRTDDIKENNCVEQLAKIAPLFTDHLYLVPKIIDSGK